MRQINLRLADELLEAVDSARGMVPRNAWLVALIENVVGEPPSPRAGRSPEPQATAPARADERLAARPIIQKKQR